MQSEGRWALPNRRGSSLVPPGFECVAHPCFFSPAHQPPAVQLVPSSALSAEMGLLCKEGLQLQRKEPMGQQLQRRERGPPQQQRQGDKDSDPSAGRHVDPMCPVCLGPFSEAVTVVTCLHTFCHKCLVSWLAHTRRAALKANADATDTSYTAAALRSRAQCPLCKQPCRHFLHVTAPDAAPDAGASTATSPSTSRGSPFKLYGVQDYEQDHEQGCESSSASLLSMPHHHGGAAQGRRCKRRRSGEGSDRGDDGSGGSTYGLPSMEQLRVAVRMQRAVAAAAAAAAAAAPVTIDLSGAAAAAAADGAGEGEAAAAAQAPVPVRERAKQRAEPLWAPGGGSARDALAAVEAQIRAEEVRLLKLQSS
eukprot:TRINITY_DN840_c2_g1_i2.p1 TRINITY_DN840_c2_g1~~TRINITY_DN840_c2_g1_i2.p1  ORF type:complete len:365 (-),score=108.54 TRINITY_DN840_c2_g1_i2:282-1376(-)